MSGFLKGERTSMGIGEMNRVYSMVVELERLAELVAPIPINFSRTDSVLALIDRYRRGEIDFYSSSSEDTNSARVQIIVAALSAADRG